MLLFINKQMAQITAIISCVNIWPNTYISNTLEMKHMIYTTNTLTILCTQYYTIVTGKI